MISAMLRTLLVLLVLAAGGLVAGGVWQHLRYLHARRDAVQDRQPLFHSSRVFHVVTFLELLPGADLFESVRKLRDALEAGGAARMVYAGKVALNARPSDQLVAAFGEAVPWDAVVCVQYPSREAYDGIAASDGYRQALAGFARSYSHGMQRSALQNLLIPQGLLALRIAQIVRREPAQYPFEPLPRDEWTTPGEVRFERLSEEHELGARAVVVVNLFRPGTAEQREADRGYTSRMLAVMAEVGYGPMHIGRAVTLEKGAEYGHVALVYYPGVEFFRSMAESRFFQGIIGGKQFADTQASITVPILGRL